MIFPPLGKGAKQNKKLVEFSTKDWTPPTHPQEWEKNEKCSVCYEMNSVWYGSSDSCKMAPPESFEVQYSLLSKILAEEGPPPKIE